MNKIRLLFTVLSLTIGQQVLAQNPIFPLGNKAPNVHHTGDVWLSHVSAADSTFDYNVAVATFSAGAKLDWHLHPKGQQLLILEGVGLYQERNQPLQIVQKGDRIKCPPGVEHWHAAAPKKGVTYLAITGNQRTKWLESVSEEQFLGINEDSLWQQQTEQAIVQLSKDKWKWMADKNVEKLAEVFDDQAKFVHMSGTWKKARELEIIKSGSIWYKQADVHDVAVEIFEDTAVLWNRITLVAHVRGNDVSNEFTVTEIYKKKDGDWKLLNLTFSKVRDTHSIKH